MLTEDVYCFVICVDTNLTSDNNSRSVEIASASWNLDRKPNLPSRIVAHLYNWPEQLKCALGVCLVGEHSWGTLVRPL